MYPSNYFFCSWTVFRDQNYEENQLSKKSFFETKQLARLNWDFKSEGRNKNMVYVNRRKVLIMFKMLKSRLHVGWEYQNRNMNLSFYCFVFIFKRTLVSTFIFSVRNMFNQELEQNVGLKYFSWSTCVRRRKLKPSRSVEEKKILV